MIIFDEKLDIQKEVIFVDFIAVSIVDSVKNSLEVSRFKFLKNEKDTHFWWKKKDHERRSAWRVRLLRK